MGYIPGELSSRHCSLLILSLNVLHVYEHFDIHYVSEHAIEVFS